MSRRTLALAAITTALLSLTATAQFGSPPVLYRLDPASSYEEGCQPPCLCPIQFTEDFFGTFTLAFSTADPAGYVHYTIDDVNWIVGPTSAEHRVTGSGEYKVGGQFAIRHQLVLDLSTDGGAPVHFDSGLVLGGGSFPAIDISIAQNNFYCYDRVFNVVASQLPTTQVQPFVLTRTIYEEGCFAPCLCPLLRKRTSGTFGVVDLGPGSDPNEQHYALVDVHWKTRPPPAPPTQDFTGFGAYSLNASTGQHRLVCDLTDANGLVQRFDSGLVAGGSQFPAKLDAAISVHGFYCLDQAFLIKATP